MYRPTPRHVFCLQKRVLFFTRNVHCRRCGRRSPSDMAAALGALLRALVPSVNVSTDRGTLRGTWEIKCRNKIRKFRQLSWRLCIESCIIMLSVSHQRYVATLWHMLSIVIDPKRLPRSLGLFTPTYIVAVSVRFQKDGFTLYSTLFSSRNIRRNTQRSLAISQRQSGIHVAGSADLRVRHG